MTTRVKKSTARLQDITNAISTENMGPQNTDITAALVTALAAGTPVYVAIGTWFFSTLTLPANSIIFGAGKKSILKQNNVANSIGMVVSAGCQLRDFLLDGNKLNQVGASFHGFDFTNATDCECSNVTAYNNKGSGFNIAGTANEVELFECQAVGWTESGFKVVAGTNITLSDCKAYSSDAVATGDGFSIASNGTAVTGVILDSCVAKSNAARGFALIGNGSKNVTAVSLTNCRASNNISHGLHLINADSCTQFGGMFNNNGGDGIRIEGDVQNCRFFGAAVRFNTGFGIREVIAGSTPNLNGLIYTVCNNNTLSNVITKVGAASYIV